MLLQLKMGCDIILEKFSALKHKNGCEGDSCQQDFDRKRASPTESAVRLDSAIREHSGAGISKGAGQDSPDPVGVSVRHTLRVREWSIGFCTKADLNAGGPAEHD